VEAAARLTEIGRLSRVDKAPRLWRLWRLRSVWRAMVEVLALERALGEGSLDRGLLDAAREDSKTIAVEYCWTGASYM
jgi:nitroreductase